LGGHIEAWAKAKRRVTIVTVFATERRSLEAHSYATTIGVQQSTLYQEEHEHSTVAAIPLDRIRSALVEALLNLSGDKVYLFPIGLKHPEHQLVASTVEMSPPLLFPFVYYLDSPYWITQSNAQELMRKVAGRRVVSILRPHARKWKYIKHFQSQDKYFFHNPPSRFVGTVEMIVDGGALVKPEWGLALV
jgi:hypothetical protein